jgi:hypothetical protein
MRVGAGGTGDDRVPRAGDAVPGVAGAVLLGGGPGGEPPPEGAPGPGVPAAGAAGDEPTGGGVVAGRFAPPRALVVVVGDDVGSATGVTTVAAPDEGNPSIDGSLAGPLEVEPGMGADGGVRSTGGKSMGPDSSSVLSRSC